MKSNWKIKAQETNNNITETLLRNRGIEPEQAESFFNPPFPNLDLALKFTGIQIADLEKAAEIVNKYISLGLPIFIHGDYDVDGITSTAILWRKIYKEKGYNKCLPFIPNRFDHGYGLSTESINGVSNLFKDNFPAEFSAQTHPKALLITVDCGITALSEVAFAESLGFEVIVVDHHSKPENLPDCLVFWSDKLCAGGLSFLLSLALGGTTEGYLELAALSTLADLQPLTLFNRSLVKWGLEELNNSKNVGLKSLIKVAGISERKIGTFEVGWVISPRLNASGRLENALESLRLLCTNDEDRALDIAKRLDVINKERQDKTASMVEVALSELSISGTSTLNVVVHEEFHEGVIGLVAGKIVSKTRAPAVVISKGKELSKASARSVDGFNIVEFLRSLGDHFQDIGGHAGAAGFTIKTENIDKFIDAVKRKIPNLTMPEVFLDIDCELLSNNINLQILDDIKKFEPFGIGNLEPIFVSRKVFVDRSSVTGTGNHLKLVLDINGTKIPAIYFGKGDLISEIPAGKKTDIAYNLVEDNWNGESKISFKIRDIVTYPLDNT